MDKKPNTAGHNCGCNAQNANMHKLMKMGYQPKVTMPSPKTPA